MTSAPFDTAVVGAGPAGLMAAITAAQQGARVALIEQQDRPGRKLLATGGGRCNLTNTAPPDAFMSRFGRRGRFIQPALAALDAGALRTFFDRLGVPTHAQDGFHVFPVSERAADVRDALTRSCAALSVECLLKTPVTGLWIGGDGLRGVELGQERLAARAVVLATGGRSYSELGATGTGYRLAAQAGHTIVAPLPALVPLVTAEDWPGRCAGLALPEARVWMARKGERKKGSGTTTSKVPAPFFRAPSPRHFTGAAGSVLFTHRGLSGPAVLDLSGDVAELVSRHGAAHLRLDPAPGTSAAAWQARFDEWATTQGAKMVRTLLGAHLPGRLAEEALGLAAVDRDVRAAHLARPIREQLARLLVALPLTVTGTEGFEKAMVTRGGVALKEVDPRSLESRLLPGLFFAGEVLDLDGPCGGYNLQWAFSSGHLAGRSAAAKATEAQRHRA